MIVILYKFLNSYNNYYYHTRYPVLVTGNVYPQIIRIE